MRILAIRGRNIASLASEFDIDFGREPLASAGIFAICGPTGSGKSTVLDAVSLALYDTTPRLARAGSRVAVLPDVGTETLSPQDPRTLLRRGASDGHAEVDFVAGDQVAYRARWSVRRARGRADGRLQPSEMTLVRLTDGRLVAASKTDVLAEIRSRVGLDFGQFTRAVLLAQNEFGAFLHADDNTRADLLERLTGTDIYSVLSTRAFERARSEQQRLDDLRQRALSLLPLDADDRASLERQVETTATRESALEAEARELDGHLRWHEQLESERAREADAVRDLDTARKTHEQSAVRRTRLAHIESVQEARALVDAVDRTTRERDDLATRVVPRVEHEAVAAQTAHERAKGDRGRSAEAVAAAERAQIEGRTASDQAVALALQVLANAESVLTGYDEAAIVSTRRQLESRRKALTATRDRHSELDRLQTHRAEAEAAAARAAHEGTAAALVIAKTETRLEPALAARDQARRALDEARLASSANVQRLRAMLVADRPCPVCGSAEHPYASSDSRLDRVLRTLEEQQREQEALVESLQTCLAEQRAIARTAADQREQARRELAEVDTSCHRARLALEADPIADEIVGLPADATATWFDERLADVDDRLARAAAEEDACRAAAAHRDAARRALDVARAEQQRVERDLEDAIRLARATLESRAACLFDAVAARAAADTRLEGARRDLKRCSSAADDAREVLDTWLATRSGSLTGGPAIDTPTLRDLLAPDAAWRSGEQRALRMLDEAVDSARSVVDERRRRREEVERARPTEQAVDVLSGRRTQVAADLVAARDEAGRLRVDLARDDERRAEARSLAAEIARQEPISSLWSRLGDLIGSRDGQKFRNYAQQLTLDILVAHANHHLVDLARRYRLRRIPDRLALLVVDRDMGDETRSVHSLSGGESFLVSLALALGLASLSAARVRVESLFIDEGFGSLDAETLAVAMDALDTLHAQGRKVGVISHVQEMAERIGARVEIERQPGGRSRVIVSC